MSWSVHHDESERLAAEAELAARHRDLNRASELYLQAARLETAALSEIASSKLRTYGITAISAVSLWYKARDFANAKLVLFAALAKENLPSFAAAQLEELLQAIWYDEGLQRAGLQFTPGHVLISVSGGKIVSGGAPLDLIMQKVDQVGRIFYRTIELILEKPFRTRSTPSLDILSQFKPWLFQAPPGSYQFAVRIERPEQLPLFPDDSLPDVENITNTFASIVKASAEDPTGRLEDLVPNKEYRDTFIKLTRNLAPSGKSYAQLEIHTPGIPGSPPIVLSKPTREALNRSLRKPQQASDDANENQETVVELRGVLRGLQLDEDWLDVNIAGQTDSLIRIKGVSDLVDDVIGPMVNHTVVVDAVLKQGKYIYRDIQPEE